MEQLFVGGGWTDRSLSGETFDVANPANGETVATLPDGGRGDMQRAVDAAAAVQAGRAATTAAYRAGIMREAARLMHAFRDRGGEVALPCRLRGRR